MKFAGIEYVGQGDDGGITYVIATGALEGEAVTLTTTATMGRGSDSDVFVGKLVKKEGDSKGTVVCHGVVVVPAAVGLTAGFKGLQVDGAGKVKAGASNAGRQALVIGVLDGFAAIDLA